MIRILARHPATARHIACQLCQRLVADDPPAGARRPRRAEVPRDGRRPAGDRAGHRREPASSSTRSTTAPRSSRPSSTWSPRCAPPAARPTARCPIARAIAQMGEPLYLCQPPTGYSDAPPPGSTPGALVARLNFALGARRQQAPGHRHRRRSVSSARADPADAEASIQDAWRERSPAGISRTKRGTTIAKRLENRIAAEDVPTGNTQLPLIAGLILGSPEFQRQ